MARPFDRDTDVGGGAGAFPTTIGTLVRGAGSEDAALRRRSFELLVAAYWRPVYKTIRIAWKRSNEDAKDLTQGFFARAMEKDFFSGYDPARARFRTFLRVCLERWVSNEHRAAGRLKRGGGQVAVALDFDAAEGELADRDPSAPTDAERLFDREWARSVFASAVEALRDECAAAGKTGHFRLFERYDLEGEAGERPSYRALADELGIAVTDVTNHLHAVRRSFRRIVLARLRELTASEEEFREEARALLGTEAT